MKTQEFISLMTLAASVPLVAVGVSPLFSCGFGELHVRESRTYVLVRAYLVFRACGAVLGRPAAVFEFRVFDTCPERARTSSTKGWYLGGRCWSAGPELIRLNTRASRKLPHVSFFCNSWENSSESLGASSELSTDRECATEIDSEVHNRFPPLI